MMNSGSLKKVRNIVWFAGILLLLWYPMRHVGVGVDMWDGGYNYANFRYHSLEHMDSMWYFATWLANAIGHMLTKLPFAETMKGMNIYTGLIISVIAVSAYLFCVKKLQVPAWLAFIGEVLAISLCWAPSSALYNYLTYGFLLAGIVLLYQGLTKQNAAFLVLAGAVLGVNIGVRFSNLVEVSLILAVWYYGWIKRKKFPEIARDTAFCVLGYIGAVVIFLGIMAAKYGLANYVRGILYLFEMTEYATDYSALHMLEGMIGAYIDSAYWLKRFGVILVCAFAGCFFLQKKKKIAAAVTVAVMLLGTGWLVQMKYLYRDHAAYSSIYDPCVIVFLMAMLLAVYQMCSCKYTADEKLQAILIPLIILLTSLGGNNAVYSSINNLFFVFPCFLGMAARFICREKTVLSFPFKGILLVGVVLLLYQGVLFGQSFVYEEASGGRALYTEITEIPVLKGMHTGEEKATSLTELYRYLESCKLQEKECILFGDIPALAYYMESAPAINVWSDLRSYGQDRMEKDLEEIDWSDQEDRPYIILEEKAVKYLLHKDAEVSYEMMAASKLEYLGKLMEEHHYQQYFNNGKYAVYY